MLTRLIEDRNNRYVCLYAAYLCRQWNRDRLGADRLASFDLYFRLERIPRNGEAPRHYLLHAASQVCEGR